jgi:cyclophilin family peptidyl-prolyl cis-trans isomerase
LQKERKNMSDSTLDPENTLHLDLKQGRVVIQLFPDIAPMHVAQIKTLVRKGFYDGTVFHRVIEGFMAQGGDPTGTGTGGSDLDNIRAEFSDTAKFLRGTCGMARSQSPHSANSQFFIMFEPASHLNGQYTIWGQVVEGMEFVDQLKRGSGGGGTVSNPDHPRSSWPETAHDERITANRQSLRRLARFPARDA